jgi:hypothetical protein
LKFGGISNLVLKAEFNKNQLKKSSCIIKKIYSEAGKFVIASSL